MIAAFMCVCLCMHACTASFTRSRWFPPVSLCGLLELSNTINLILKWTEQAASWRLLNTQTHTQKLSPHLVVLNLTWGVSGQLDLSQQPLREFHSWVHTLTYTSHSMSDISSCWHAHYIWGLSAKWRARHEKFNLGRRRLSSSSSV